MRGGGADIGGGGGGGKVWRVSRYWRWRREGIRLRSISRYGGRW